MFKVWFPRSGEWLEALETEIRFEPTRGEFTAVLSRGGLVFDGRPITRLRGRWVRERGILLTTAVVEVGSVQSPRQSGAPEMATQLAG